MQKNMSSIKQTGSSMQVPGGHDAEPQHDDCDRDEREGKVHEREQAPSAPGKTKRCTLTFLSSEDASMIEVSAWLGGIRHDGEGDVTHDEVERVHLRRDRAVATLGEDGGEHDGHHDHHEQRVEHTPGDARGTLRRYLILKSLLTSCLRIKISF